MVVPLGLVVKHPTHVHHDVTLTEDLRVPGPHNFGITILRQHLEEDASEDLTTVKGAVMCSNPDHFDNINKGGGGVKVRF